MPKEILDAPVSSFRLPADAWAVGQSLQELNLRAQTGATVLAVRRGGSTTRLPIGIFRLQANDDMFLLGDDSDVLLARSFLTEGPRAARGLAPQ